MRAFILYRSEDVTGVSGVGIVAEGVEFFDGTVALRWCVGEHRSTVLWPGILSVVAVHGHDGKTEVIWYDGAQPLQFDDPVIATAFEPS